jgi:multidrug resistance efflux pump
MSFNFKSSDNKLQKQAKYAPAKRHTAKWQWYLLVLIIISPIFYFGYKFFSDSFIPKADGHVTFDKLELKSPANLYIKKIYIKQGEKVKKNQLLVLLDDPESMEEVKYLNNEIEFLNNKKSSTKNPELKHLLEMKSEAQNYLEEIKKNYGHLLKLRKKGLSTFLELQEARTDLNEARVQVYEMDKKIAESNHNYELKIEELYDAKIRKLKAEIEKVKHKHDVCNIRTPQDGTVLELNVDEKEYATMDKELLVIATDKNMHIRAYLPSKFLSKGIQEGTKVTLTFPDNIERSGIIYKIKKKAELNPNANSVIKKEKNRVVILIKIVGDFPVKYKISGLPVEVSFDLMTSIL